jgi:hypothetical protein
MARAGDVLGMLCVGVEVSLMGDKYEDINWHGNSPAITKAEYIAGFATYDALQAGQDEAKLAAKASGAAKLAALGFTEEEIDAW